MAIRHRHSHLRDRLRDDSHEPLVRPRTGTRNRSTSDGNLRRLGLMPRPERACAAVIGSADGRVILESVVAALARDGVAQVS